MEPQPAPGVDSTWNAVALVSCVGRRPAGRVERNLMRPLQIAVIASVLLFARAVPSFAQARPTGIVTASTAEFRIPLTRSISSVWTWNQATTAADALEYTWEVSVKHGSGSYECGFYLYKFPGSREGQGQLPDLLRAGQMSVFESDAEGRGRILPAQQVSVSVDNGAILIRIPDAALVRLMFGDRPETVRVRTRTPEATFETMPVTYRE
jgi:hypothetical protein